MDQVEYDVLQSYLVTSRFPDDYTKNQKAHSLCSLPLYEAPTSHIIDHITTR